MKLSEDGSKDLRSPGESEPAHGFSFATGFSDRFSAQGSAEDVTSFSPRVRSSKAIRRTQYTKLEVVKARQVERLLRWQHGCVGVASLFTVIVIILTRTSFRGTFSPPSWGGLELPIFRIPTGLQWFNHVSTFIAFVYMFALSIVYTRRILGIRSRDRTHEQVWVIWLLVCLTAYLIPFTSTVKMNEVLGQTYINPEERDSSKDWFASLATFFFILRHSAFTASTIFYIWSTVHSYRLLDARIGLLFYSPKVIVLGIYIALKCMVYYQYNIIAADPILTTMFGMIATFRLADRWPMPGVLYGILSFVFELGIGAYIVRETSKTRSVLKNADYLKYRSKQIGFRFFVYHNMVFYFFFWALYMTLLLGLPGGLNAFQIIQGGQSNFEVLDFRIGIQVTLLAYATVEAYANLPADALGAKGWFVPQFPSGTDDQKELEPITYRKREPPSLQGVVSDMNVNCFVMQTHVTMFNFAWLVYYWDTPKVESFKLTQDVFKFSVAQFIKDKPTDTHVLIVDGADRIVIAFKGTTSTKNLQTDINMFYKTARNLLPTRIGGEYTDDDEAAMGNPLFLLRGWRRAKVHMGFATAYGAVAPLLLATVQRLQYERKRPVFLTGHSLGGALATICSLDLHLRLGISRREIFVSSFGAPRVGNQAFCNIYNDLVPIHWRIVVGPDVVAKLPKIGFTHVGKKVLITVDGDLFIDPNSLELNLWSGDLASILYHRKASYLLAMRAWCERHHGDEYLPEFWPFPVSKDDTRRFEHAMVRSYAGNSRTQGQIFGALRHPTQGPLAKRARLRQLDAMIDALSGPDNANISPEVLMRWRNLTLKAMDDDDEHID